MRVSCSEIVRKVRQPYRPADDSPAPTDRVALVPGQLPNRQRLSLVEHAFGTLADRYLGASPGFDATYHVRLCDLGRSWEVRCTSQCARVRKGATKRTPDVTITTDSDTWMRLRQGEFSGVEAFQQRLLSVHGNLDHAMAFEGMFRLVGCRPPLLQIHDIPVGPHRVSTLTMGRGPDVLLLHGLGGTRASLLETAAALSRRYRVHAPDLPGFGSSSKPLLGAYNARWFADIMLGGTSTSRRRSGWAAFTRACPGCACRRCSCGVATTRSSPPPSAAACARGSPAPSK